MIYLAIFCVILCMVAAALAIVSKRNASHALRLLANADELGRKTDLHLAQARELLDCGQGYQAANNPDVFIYRTVVKRVPLPDQSGIERGVVIVVPLPVPFDVGQEVSVVIRKRE